MTDTKRELVKELLRALELRMGLRLLHGGEDKYHLIRGAFHLIVRVKGAKKSQWVTVECDTHHDVPVLTPHGRSHNPMPLNESESDFFIEICSLIEEYHRQKPQKSKKMRKSSRGRTSYHCPFCSEVVSNLDTLTHLKTSHPEEYKKRYLQPFH